MNLILGFGSTEKEVQKIVIDKIIEIVEHELSTGADEVYQDFITDEQLQRIESSVKKLQEEIRAQYDVADNSISKPERYYHISFGLYIATTINLIFFKVGFWHINSRHPFSPDGIALFQEEVVFAYDNYKKQLIIN